VQDPKADVPTARLTKAFEDFIRDYPTLDVGRRINPIDAFALWRTLLRRNPDPASELPTLLSYSGTYRELLTQLADSDEFKRASPILPRGFTWMAEVDGFRFWFDTGDREMGVLMATGNYEPEVRELMKTVIRPGMRCIDAGASTGYYSCLMATLVGPAGKVHAFEPMPSSFRLLNKNVKENNLGEVVKAYQLACSSSSRAIDATVSGNMYIARTDNEGEKVSMEAAVVDELISGVVDVIKIDVEGYEIEALGGMSRIIRDHRPVIFSEINEYWLRTCAKASGNAYLEYLNDFGYRVCDVKCPEIELQVSRFRLDVLETLDVVAYPKDRQA
jgi:FkbM family methyltransferase